jgi:prepilin-type processing-associated H-X9-DG protein
LAALILPALANAKARATGAACLNNLKQLQACWQIYVDDHEGFVPLNTAHFTNGAWRSTPDSWAGNSSAPHDPDATALEGGVLFREGYTRTVRLYHCPADKSPVRSLQGQDLGMLRTRSYSMNGNLGGRTSEVQRVLLRAGDIPNPIQPFVFVDEHPDSIDDGHFLVWPAPDERWVNLPADRHGQAGVLSFADGHVERWKWKAPKSFRHKVNYWTIAQTPEDLADLRRLQGASLTEPDLTESP